LGRRKDNMVFRPFIHPLLILGCFFLLIANMFDWSGFIFVICLALLVEAVLFGFTDKKNKYTKWASWIAIPSFAIIFLPILLSLFGIHLTWYFTGIEVFSTFLGLNICSIALLIASLFDKDK